MKVSLEDKDLDAIAARVAKVLGKTPGKAAATVEEETTEEEETGGDEESGEGADFEGDTGGEGEEAKTREDVKEALTNVSKKFGQDTAMEILKTKGGAAALSKLKDAKFAAVIAACHHEPSCSCSGS